MENEKLCLKDYFFSLHFAVNHTNLLFKKMEEIQMYSGRDCHLKPIVKIYAAFTFMQGGSFINIGYSWVEYLAQVHVYVVSQTAIWDKDYFKYWDSPQNRSVVL